MPRPLIITLALASLAACLIVPVLYATGTLTEGDYKTAFLVASAGWFLFASLWSRKR